MKKITAIVSLIICLVIMSSCGDKKATIGNKVDFSGLERNNSKEQEIVFDEEVHQFCDDDFRITDEGISFTNGNDVKTVVTLERPDECKLIGIDSAAERLYFYESCADGIGDLCFISFNDIQTGEGTVVEVDKDVFYIASNNAGIWYGKNNDSKVTYADFVEYEPSSYEMPQNTDYMREVVDPGVDISDVTAYSIAGDDGKNYLHLYSDDQGEYYYCTNDERWVIFDQEAFWKAQQDYYTKDDEEKGFEYLNQVLSEAECDISLFDIFCQTEGQNNKKYSDVVDVEVVSDNISKVVLFSDTVNAVKIQNVSEEFVKGNDIAGYIRNQVFSDDGPMYGKKEDYRSLKRYTDEELLDRAIAYSQQINDGEYSFMIDDGVNDGTVSIRLFIDGPEKITTLNWYYVDVMTAKGVDLFDNPIDLSGIDLTAISLKERKKLQELTEVFTDYVARASYEDSDEYLSPKKTIELDFSESKFRRKTIRCMFDAFCNDDEIWDHYNFFDIEKVSERVFGITLENKADGVYMGDWGMYSYPDVVIDSVEKLDEDSYVVSFRGRWVQHGAEEDNYYDIEYDDLANCKLYVKKDKNSYYGFVATKLVLERTKYTI